MKRIEAALAQKPWTYKGKGDPRDMHQVVKDIDVTVKALKVVGLSPAQIDTIVDKLGDSLAARLAN
ncbi:hypothetical protein [Streptomyces filamentosus]|uniref:hypothetical protein n=1 Tax=Streptomyces filamentosus TaxID=67294 RepID=UPI00123C2BC2|nr:hypothetical protein [Streptomyces filamentosus]KAA6220001.1 hypothetical protein CP979_26220 [Streptomyces filamentosus]